MRLALAAVLLAIVPRTAHAADELLSEIPVGAVVESTGGFSAFAWSADLLTVAYSAKRGEKTLLVEGKTHFEADAVEYVGFSPAADEVVSITREGGKAVLRIGGVAAARCDELRPPRFSGFRWALPARSGSSWRMLADGKEGPASEEVGSPVFGSGGRLAYWRLEKGRALLWLDGKAFASEPASDLSRFDDPEFGPDGRALEYERPSSTEALSAVEGAPKPEPEPEGASRWAQVGGDWRMLVDGRPTGPAAEKPGLLEMAGTTPVATFRSEGGWRVSVGEKVFGPFDELGPTLIDAKAKVVRCGVRIGRELWRREFPLP